jgi:hypothetical protein
MSDKAKLLELFAKKHKLTPAAVRAVADKLAPPLEITEEYLNEHFPALCDVEIPPTEVIVEDHMIKGGVALKGGVWQGFKTMAELELCAAIIEPRLAFEHFKVYKSYPITYCCPDMHIGLLRDYAAPFGLNDRSVGTKFRIAVFKDGVIHAIDSDVMKRHAEGRILVLDTMGDYARIQKAFESDEWVVFYQKLHCLINQYGCIAIEMLAHPTKSAAGASSIDPVAFVKDSITVAGKVDISFAYSPQPETSQIFVQRIKGRGFKRTKKDFTYTITTHSDSGENYLDQGRFPVHLQPGEAGKKSDHTSKAGRKPDEHRDKKVAFLMTLPEDLTAAEKTVLMNEKFTSDHTQHTVKTWLARESARKKIAAKEAADAAEMAALQGTFLPEEPIEEEKEIVQ